MKKSNLDVAFELISKKKKAVDFLKLWEEVSSIQGLSVEESNARAGKFFTQLSLDGRFITFNGTSWELRARQKFENVESAMKKNNVEDTLDEELKEKDENLDKDLDEDEDENSDYENDGESEYSNEEY